MSNWFEENQTKSVILYTLLIAAATWAFYRFTFEEQKIDFFKAQVESSKTEIEQYKSRIDFLEKENTKFSVILKEFEDWNYKSKDPTLFYKSKYEEIVNDKNKLDSIFSKSDRPIIDNSTSQTNKKISFQALNIVIKKGKSYINDNEKLIIGVNDVSVEGLCDFTLSVDNTINEVHKNVKVGTSSKLGKLKITLSETNFITSEAKFHITKE